MHNLTILWNPTLSELFVGTSIFHQFVIANRKHFAIIRSQCFSIISFWCIGIARIFVLIIVLFFYFWYFCYSISYLLPNVDYYSMDSEELMNSSFCIGFYYWYFFIYIFLVNFHYFYQFVSMIHFQPLWFFYPGETLISVFHYESLTDLNILPD
jgi:hypothetical protein